MTFCDSESVRTFMQFYFFRVHRLVKQFSKNDIKRLSSLRIFFNNKIYKNIIFIFFENPIEEEPKESHEMNRKDKNH